jgi:hypothetical protein
MTKRPDVQICLLGCTVLPEDKSELHARRRENLKSHKRPDDGGCYETIRVMSQKTTIFILAAVRNINVFHVRLC